MTGLRLKRSPVVGDRLLGPARVKQQVCQTEVTLSMGRIHLHRHAEISLRRRFVMLISPGQSTTTVEFRIAGAILNGLCQECPGLIGVSRIAMKGRQIDRRLDKIGLELVAPLVAAPSVQCVSEAAVGIRQIVVGLLVTRRQCDGSSEGALCCHDISEILERATQVHRRPIHCRPLGDSILPKTQTTAPDLDALTTQDSQDQ